MIANTVPAPDAPKLAGLFSPPDSNVAMNLDSSDSELSDIEEDGARVVKAPKLLDAEVVIEPKEPEVAEPKEPEVEDIGEVTPDHYDDEGRVPVFKPTMTQFKDFEVFVSSQ